MKAKSGIKETPLHIQIVHLLRLDFRPDDLIFAHPPNGGFRNAREAATLKKMGVLPGISDLLFWWPIPVRDDNGITSAWLDTGFIEIKTLTGTVQQSQKDFSHRITSLGGKYAIARSYEQVRDTLIGWGVRCQKRAIL